MVKIVEHGQSRNIKIGRLVRSILKVSVSFIEKDIETLLINIRRHLTFPKNMITI
jgi:hypothetical protein